LQGLAARIHFAWKNILPIKGPASICYGIVIVHFVFFERLSAAKIFILQPAGHQ
jgi:hypothetical protein